MEALIEENGLSADARRLFERLENAYMVLSFSSGHSQKMEAQRLQKAGFLIPQERIYTSTMAAADAIRHHWPDRVHMDMIGTKAMEEILHTAGFIRTGKPDWFFVGKNRQACFDEYSNALEMIMQGAKLVSLDSCMRQYLHGHVVLGEGAIVKMLEAASQTQALPFDQINLWVLKQAARYGNFQTDAVAVVDCGKRWHLEELNQAGIQTVLVAHQGISENLFQAQIHPTWIVKSLAGLYRTLYGA